MTIRHLPWLFQAIQKKIKKIELFGNLFKDNKRPPIHYLTHRDARLKETCDNDFLNDLLSLKIIDQNASVGFKKLSRIWFFRIDDANQEEKILYTESEISEEAMSNYKIFLNFPQEGTKKAEWQRRMKEEGYQLELVQQSACFLSLEEKISSSKIEFLKNLISFPAFNNQLEGFFSLLARFAFLFILAFILFSVYNTPSASCVGKDFFSDAFEVKNEDEKAEEIKNISFADIGGLQAAKEELREVLFLLSKSDQVQKCHLRIPKGILLVGPPGNGKTLLAKAFAGEWTLTLFDFYMRI